MSLPINFEEKVKAAPAANGTGYPYRISATDLMKNFVFASVEVPLVGENGLNGITETITIGMNGHPKRQISTTPLDPGTTVGDMLYWDGNAWTVLAPPSSGLHVLTHDGTTPAWSQTSECP